MKLSRREHDVFTLMACGFTDKEVSTKLKISIRTVQTHINKGIIKLGARNRINAAVLYLKQNPGWGINERNISKK